MRLYLLLLLLFAANSGFGQGSTASPMGVLIRPAKKVSIPAELRSAVPEKSTVRLIESVRLSNGDETVIIYDRGNQFEPHAHIAVAKNGKRVADFSLIKLFQKEGVGDTYAFFQAVQFTTPDNRSVFIAAFRNIGDGAGTLFVLLTEKDGQYAVAWRKWASQAQLRVRRGEVQLWASDEGDDCVWCPHHYEVSNFVWKEGGLSKVSHYETKRPLSPSQFSEKPIIFEH